MVVAICSKIGQKLATGDAVAGRNEDLGLDIVNVGNLDDERLGRSGRGGRPGWCGCGLGEGSGGVRCLVRGILRIQGYHGTAAGNEHFSGGAGLDLEQVEMAIGQGPEEWYALPADQHINCQM